MQIIKILPEHQDKTIVWLEGEYRCEIINRGETWVLAVDK
jgi:hypothetical protein